MNAEVTDASQSVIDSTIGLNNPQPEEAKNVASDSKNIITLGCMAAILLVIVYVFIYALKEEPTHEKKNSVRNDIEIPKEAPDKTIVAKETQNRKMWCSFACTRYPRNNLDHVPDGLCSYLVYSYYTMDSNYGALFTCAEHKFPDSKMVDDFVRYYRPNVKKILEVGHTSHEYIEAHYAICKNNDCGQLENIVTRFSFNGAILSFEYANNSAQFEQLTLDLCQLFAEKMQSIKKHIYGFYILNPLERQEFRVVSKLMSQHTEASIFILNTHEYNRRRLNSIFDDAVCSQPAAVTEKYPQTYSMPQIMNAIVDEIGEQTWTQYQRKIAITVDFMANICTYQNQRCAGKSRSPEPFKKVCYNFKIKSNAKSTLNKDTDCGELMYGNNFASGIFNSTGRFWSSVKYGVLDFYIYDTQDDDFTEQCEEPFKLLKAFGSFIKNNN